MRDMNMARYDMHLSPTARDSWHNSRRATAAVKHFSAL